MKRVKLKSLSEQVQRIADSAQKPTILLALAGLLTAILTNFEFSLLESYLYDFRVSRSAQPKPDGDIALVTLDDQTTSKLDEFAPLTLDYHAQFMEALAELEPKAVGYLIDFTKVNQANPELFKSQWGSRFINAAEKLEAKGTPVMIGTSFDVTGEVLPPYPLSALSHSVSVVHKDGNVFAEDKVTRRALTHIYDHPVFHLELAQRLGLIHPDRYPRGSYYIPEADLRYFFFRYHGNPSMRQDSLGRLPYQRVSFLDVIKQTPAAKLLAGKIVLIGSLTREDGGDYSLTPYSKAPYTSPKLAIHANILDSIIHDDGILQSPRWLDWIVTFAIISFVFVWVVGSTPLSGLLMILGLAAVFLISIQATFSLYGIWIKGSQPLIGIFLGYYLVVPYRLTQEYRKRWEYQRKNEILVQVEELKTNFLSLVTHDLKTPVARIQGLAEVLINKAGERLNERDKLTVHNMIDATDELNRFITSILELNKVESNRLQLNYESKDLNQLVERAIDSFKATARAKQIEIISELEPLFPIKLDVSLVSKILNNLIDNALKYSPPDSQILVKTRELDPWVEFSVKDQGIGLTAEEQSRLFTRFYRAKNDTTTQIAGTGLGLYLSKYFVEAHQGRVEVISAPGQGSTFKILLPLQVNPSKSFETDSKSNMNKPGLTHKLGGIWQRKKEKANV